LEERTAQNGNDRRGDAGSAGPHFIRGRRQQTGAVAIDLVQLGQPGNSADRETGWIAAATGHAFAGVSLRL